jgi:16S rRNA G527 N7-methylase RsmG
VGKKIRAIEEFSAQLGLRNVEFLHMRGEAFLETPRAKEIDTIVMRAVAPVERALPWLNASVARWVLFLGPQQVEGWKEEHKKLARKNLAFGREFSFSLPRNAGDRILLEIVRG